MGFQLRPFALRSTIPLFERIGVFFCVKVKDSLLLSIRKFFFTLLQKSHNCNRTEAMMGRVKLNALVIKNGPLYYKLNKETGRLEPLKPLTKKRIKCSTKSESTTGTVN